MVEAFRHLWRPPGRYADRDPDRRVSFLELFFDLVFVAIVAQLAHALAANPSWEGVGWFVFLFYAVWSAWLNGTYYHDLHGSNDLSIRLFTFAQMLAVAVVAVYAGRVPGSGTAGFAISYAVNCGLLVTLWFRTGLHDPSHRPASIPYSAAYLISAILFALSPLAGGASTYWLWAVALVGQGLGLMVALRRWTPPETQIGDAVIALSPSLLERIGLFVIIVLGEVVVGSVNGMTEVMPLSGNELIVGLLGLVVAIGLWWVYFDLVAHRSPISRFTQLWLYLHLPVVIALAGTGAAMVDTIEHATEPLPDPVRWLLVGSVATALTTVATVILILKREPEDIRVFAVATRALLVGAGLILAIGLTHWGAVTSLVATVALMLVPVGAGLRVWARSTQALP